ncbi:cation:proton antiporter [Gloeocapsa sp. PCC 73106]|uniref:cation:proton antiporter n=1 Tax=Gloeocapsa sp. PCC 73106 TaxID=102232 RepID=UPI0002AC01D0|nr:cation:proton antiporter [Gloeocapsa sp. PCC 73106]ELR97646.1 formate hydrogenlyase subunit 3/multisubunit Na+/H+ antiporter, MnhD subunit [Gloeocapsa sp. PCC 73106]
MSNITIAWLALPFFLGFLIYLFPKSDRYLGLVIGITSTLYALTVLISDSPLSLQLVDSFGVTLLVDQLSGYFILTNGLVTLAVIIYCWTTPKTSFFYTQATILHGSVNAVFICADLISLYVALEVISIAVFLLIAYPRSDRSIWVALRYLFISNTAMLFYLIGAVLVYQSHHTFSFAGLETAPPEGIALILMGLLTKGGIFISGFWLPLTHSESESPVSALLSGIVIKAGAFPLIRFSLMLEDIGSIVTLFGVGAAVLGVSYAIFEKDTKRLLALSTISQLGWMLAAPPVAGFYALNHGLAKASLFLTVGALPSRNFQELEQRPINTQLWIVLVIGALSLSGFPLLGGFGAKSLVMGYLSPWQTVIMSLAAVGTAIAFAKVIFLRPGGKEPVRAGVWLGVSILSGALIIAGFVFFQVYTFDKIAKALITIALGWLAYGILIRKFSITLPRVLEQFEHLIGMMSLIVILVFWMVWV